LSNILKIKQLSDEEIIALYKQEKNKACLEELFMRYTRFVIAVSMKYVKQPVLAREIAMEVFEKAMNDLLRFEILNFKSWIYQVAKNACLMKLRSKKSKFIYIEDKKDALKIMESEVDLHHQFEEKEILYNELESAVNQLDEGQKKCIQLFYLQEKNYAEVARLTGYSLNEVKSYIQNGKRNLKNCLTKTSMYGVMAYILLLNPICR
jgi:RNA polymerase sigma factor (sigma-70 family)